MGLTVLTIFLVVVVIVAVVAYAVITLADRVSVTHSHPEGEPCTSECVSFGAYRKRQSAELSQFRSLRDSGVSVDDAYRLVRESRK